jgi:hypothetical protein
MKRENGGTRERGNEKRERGNERTRIVYLIAIRFLKILY